MCLLDYEFGTEYDIMLSSWGEGILSESNLLDFQQPDVILQKYMDQYRRKPKSISLYLQDPAACGYDYGFTGVDTALLEKLEQLKELILPPSVTEIRMTPGLEIILDKNHTMIRGTFDSFAERFAADHGLRFRHSDFVFAEYEPPNIPESTRLTMQFRRDGSAVIKEEVSSPGASASHTLGGTYYHRLSSTFCSEKTVEEIAGIFKAELRDAVLRDGRLADYMDQAKIHKLFTGYNR